MEHPTNLKLVDTLDSSVTMIVAICITETIESLHGHVVVSMYEYAVNYYVEVYAVATYGYDGEYCVGYYIYYA